MIRRAEDEADLARCVDICNAVQPEEPVALEDFKRFDDDRTFFLHEAGGYAHVARSSVANSAFTMVRVHPAVRGRGIGTALLDVVTEEARQRGVARMVGRVAWDDDRSRGFLARRGFRELVQDVTLLRELAGDEGEIPDGIVLLADEHLEGAYRVEVECVPDMPTGLAMQAKPYEDWVELLRRNRATFVALDGGTVVGYATLEPLAALPHRLEHGLTAVLRSHRGRGLATRLKRAQIAWAAANGYRELVTWTQEGNAAMRRVNLKLGYAEQPGPLMVQRAVASTCGGR